MKYEPREHQRIMIEAMVKNERMNIFASPGSGKTSSVLEALSQIQMFDGDAFPALVVAPKTVALTVWSQEAMQWDEFNGLKVSVVLGKPHERIEALETPAHIYTINPDNLVWLIKQLDGEWPFNTVVIDESTKIKNHRCSVRKSKKDKTKTFLVKAGTQNASTLVMQANKTKRWINLTGTPVPNGLKDAWGQCFPIDFGKSLGR